MTRFVRVSRLHFRWWLSGLLLAGWLISSCAPPPLPPETTTPSAPPHVTADPAEAARTNDPAFAPQPDRLRPQPSQTSLPPRDVLERRIQGVMTCLEKARQAVVAAEIAGAGIEAVRPSIDALHRAERALREAQSRLISGDHTQAVSPLERAEVECRTVLASGH